LVIVSLKLQTVPSDFNLKIKNQLNHDTTRFLLADHKFVFFALIDGANFCAP